METLSIDIFGEIFSYINTILTIKCSRINKMFFNIIHSIHNIGVPEDNTVIISRNMSTFYLCVPITKMKKFKAISWHCLINGDLGELVGHVKYKRLYCYRCNNEDYIPFLIAKNYDKIYFGNLVRNSILTSSLISTTQSTILLSSISYIQSYYEDKKVVDAATFISSNWSCDFRFLKILGECNLISRIQKLIIPLQSVESKKICESEEEDINKKVTIPNLQEIVIFTNTMEDRQKIKLIFESFLINCPNLKLIKLVNGHHKNYFDSFFNDVVINE